MNKKENNGRKTFSEMLTIPSANGDLDSRGRRAVGRRSFLKGLGMAGATLLPASALLMTEGKADDLEDNDGRRKLTKGDAAILRFLAAAEILESDIWEQYWELGSAAGIRSGFASTNPATGTAPTPTGGNAQYTTALQLLDGDMPQHITDNTDDEFSHSNFLLAYLKSKGADTADLDLLVGPHFRTLQGSVATGSTKKGRLTNLTKLTVDTSFLGSVPLGQQEPRSRRHIVRSSSSDLKCGATYGNSQN